MSRKLIKRGKRPLAKKATYLKWMSISIFVLLLIGTLTLIFASLYLEVERKYELYQTQNKCIAHYIQQGVERSDIRRVGKSCTIRGQEQPLE